MEGRTQFRGVAFGGFHRQDVLDYVEASTEENRAEQERLRNHLAAEKRNGEECRERLEKLQQEHTSEMMLNQQLTQRLDTTQAQLTKQTAELVRVQEELKQLRAKVEKSEPAAQAYAHIKDRTATIELEAHARAQILEDEATQKAEELHQKGVNWTREIQEKYKHFRKEVDGSIANMTMELTRVQHSFEVVSHEFDGHDEQMEALLAQSEKEIELA
ncbi:MAG: hypothetical protein RR053_07280 [Evtepia sp.]